MGPSTHLHLHVTRQLTVDQDRSKRLPIRYIQGTQLPASYCVHRHSTTKHPTHCSCRTQKPSALLFTPSQCFVLFLLPLAASELLHPATPPASLDMSRRATFLVPVLLLAVLSLHTLAAAQSPPQTLADVQIASISGCVDVYPITVNCSLATTTLRIQTLAGFPASMDLSVYQLFVTGQVNDFSYFTPSAVWPDASDSTNRSVYVNMSVGGYYPHITGALISVSFIDYYALYQPTSAAFAGLSYRFEGPPTLTSIGGCDGSGQQTLNCVPDLAVIQLTGSGLLWLSSSRDALLLSIGNVTTALTDFYTQVINDTYATVSLQWLYGQLLKPQHYAGKLLSFNLTSLAYNRARQVVSSYTTNSLYLSFVQLPPPSIVSWYSTYPDISKQAQTRNMPPSNVHLALLLSGCHQGYLQL